MARQVNGHLGTFSSLSEVTTKFPPAEYVGCSANIGVGIPYTKAWCNGAVWSVVDAQGVQSLLTGARVVDSTSRNITVNDNGQFLAPTTSVTYTIPAGLTPMPSFTVLCPASGTISIARATGVTLNGGTTTLTRTRAANPVGFVVLAHEADAYGVSGA